MITDCNFIWDVNSKTTTFKIYNDNYQGKKELSLEEWNTMGYDCMSRFDNPQFMDYDNFTLDENSYVFKYGFPKEVITDLARRVDTVVGGNSNDNL
jgi:hypothetical protein